MRHKGEDWCACIVTGGQAGSGGTMRVFCGAVFLGVRTLIFCGRFRCAVAPHGISAMITLCVRRRMLAVRRTTRCHQRYTGGSKRAVTRALRFALFRSCGPLAVCASTTPTLYSGHVRRWGPCPAIDASMRLCGKTNFFSASRGAPQLRVCVETAAMELWSQRQARGGVLGQKTGFPRLPRPFLDLAASVRSYAPPPPTPPLLP